MDGGQEGHTRTYPHTRLRRTYCARALQRLGNGVGLRAELRAVRNTGIAPEREESGRGVACAAAPIRINEDLVIAALSVSAGPGESPCPSCFGYGRC